MHYCFQPHALEAVVVKRIYNENFFYSYNEVPLTQKLNQQDCWVLRKIFTIFYPNFHWFENLFHQNILDKSFHFEGPAVIIYIGLNTSSSYCKRPVKRVLEECCNVYGVASRGNILYSRKIILSIQINVF